jgi:uncharacterized protein YndB with AHSA1/START domain
MSAGKPSQNASDREIVVTRLIEAPIARVWRAWVDPKEIVRWWGPHGFTTDSDGREFKPGGVWKHTMIGPDGTRYPNAARFEEIVEHERIVYTNGGGTGDRPGVHFRSTVTFKNRDGKTELTLRLVFDTAAMCDDAVKHYGAIEGGNQTLSRLAAQVQGEFVTSRLVDAPRERVWRAWTDPSELGLWFGPKGFKTIHAKLDLRPGGSYHYGIEGNGVEMWGKWAFRDIDKPAKLQFIQTFSDKDGGVGVHPMAPTWPKRTLSTILFQDFGPKTLVTVCWAPFEATEIERDTFLGGLAGMNEGWSGTFERLDAYLKEPAFELVVTRVIAAPRERVFEAWSEPARLTRWFAPLPYTLPLCEMDFRPGGRFRMAMRSPAGEDHEFSGVYREIVPPSKLVWTGEFASGPVDQVRTEITFEEEGTKTKLSVRQTFSVLTPETEPHTKGAKQGWTATLDQLQALAEAGA